MHEDTHFKVLRIIESNPKITQRDLAKTLGISLGKANYCVKALIEKGWIKTNNFKNSKNKLAYAYILTPEGLKQKKLITVSFLQRKLQEYEELKLEIERLTEEVKVHSAGDQ